MNFYGKFYSDVQNQIPPMLLNVPFDLNSGGLSDLIGWSCCKTDIHPIEIDVKTEMFRMFVGSVNKE